MSDTNKKVIVVNIDLKDKAEEANEALVSASKWLGAVGAVFVVGVLSDIAGFVANDRFWFIVGEIACYLIWILLCVYWARYAQYQYKRGEFVGWSDACGYIKGQIDDSSNEKNDAPAQTDASKA